MVVPTDDSQKAAVLLPKVSDFTVENKFFLFVLYYIDLNVFFFITESPPPPYSRLSPNEEHKPLGKHHTRHPCPVCFQFDSLLWLSTWNVAGFDPVVMKPAAI